MRSLQIQLSDHAYAALAAVAQERGRSVEVAAADELEAGLLGGTDEIPGSFWTSEVLASLDAAVAEADRGGGISLDDMRVELAERSRKWRESHPA